MQREQQLICFYTQHGEIKNDSGSINVSQGEWKVLDKDIIFSTHFNPCAAVVAILGELQDQRIALYLYHADIHQSDQKKFTQEMINQGVRIIHIFSKTADLQSRQFHNTPILIENINQVLIQNGKENQVTVNRIEVPSYTEIQINRKTQEVFLNLQYIDSSFLGAYSVPQPKQQTPEQTIFMDLSQVISVLQAFGDSENQGGALEDDGKAEKNYFNVADIKQQQKQQIAQNILDYQAEDGNDPLRIRIFKATARTLECDVGIVSDGKYILIQPSKKNSEIKPLFLEEKVIGGASNEYSRLPAGPKINPTIITTDSIPTKNKERQILEKELFAKRNIKHKEDEKRSSLSKSPQVALLTSKGVQNKNKQKDDSGCCPMQCIIL